MKNKPKSPQILRHSWGKIEVEEGFIFKDAKLYPGGSREWDWRETGTQHSPGIQPADVKELMDHGARRIILSKGRQNRLQVCPETLQVLEINGVVVEVLETGEAIRRYNLLREEEPVGGLFHSTC